MFLGWVLIIMKWVHIFTIFVLDINNSLTICFFRLPYNSAEKTILYPISFSQWCHPITCMFNGSAFVINTYSRTYTSFVAHNHEGQVDGCGICIGV